jgi:glutamate synthase (NADPH) small chain
VRDKFLEELNLGYNAWGAIPSNGDDDFGTKEPGVFVAGDAKRGASLIVWAIAEGRKAARQADQYLTGKSMLSSLEGGAPLNPTH